MKFREHDIEAARKWYGEAVQLDSKSYLALYYFASMSLQSGEQGQDDVIEKSLLSSIEFNPKFAPSYDALANFYASRHIKLDQAHKLSVQAVSLEPKNIYYRLNAANVLAQTQDFSNALAVLKAALHVANSPSETEMVQGRIDQMETFLARRDSARNASSNADASGTTTMVEKVGNDQSGVRKISTLPVLPDDPGYPAGAPGAKHTVSGVIHGVKCSYPSVLALTLAGSGKPIALYSNNYFQIPFSTLGYLAKGDLSPCTQIEGTKANIVYGEVTDTRVAGQIVSIELVK